MKYITIFLAACFLMLLTSLRAQDVTITLDQGWTWISYPRADTLPLNHALSVITPSQGDIIKSQMGFSMYDITDGWQGSLSEFIPGKGYMYKSNREGSFSFVFPEPATSFPEGALPGQFTINGENGKVYFSQGNLQYQASTNTWKFAENQYDYIGSANSNISSSYSGWIDLFGWGTSGYNHGAVCYQPWSTSANSSDYYAYGSYTNNLNSGNGTADWGYNAISNGGNQENQWRTLTRPEWDYVFNTRSTTSGIRYAKAQVNSVNGVILLPDDWSTSYYTLNNTNTSGAAFTSNVVDSSTWQSSFEAHGAVFLPAAGYRSGTSVYSVGSYGNYWSSSYSNSYYACSVSFYSSYLYSSLSDYRYYGKSFRLVRAL